MAKADEYRMQEKREVIAARIKEIAPNADVLIGMLDETKLDDEPR